MVVLIYLLIYQNDLDIFLIYQKLKSPELFFWRNFVSMYFFEVILFHLGIMWKIIECLVVCIAAGGRHFFAYSLFNHQNILIRVTMRFL